MKRKTAIEEPMDEEDNKPDDCIVCQDEIWAACPHCSQPLCGNHFNTPCPHEVLPEVQSVKDGEEVWHEKPVEPSEELIPERLT